MQLPLKTILVVEQEAETRIFLANLLRQAGFAMLAAEAGAQGLEMARRLRPDLIILDAMMIGEHGALCYREFRAEPELRCIPLLVLATVDQRIFYHLQRSRGQPLPLDLPQPEGYLLKPVATEAFLTMVRSLTHTGEAPCGGSGNPSAGPASGSKDSSR
jgi:CheY-like chemotaxis protein